MRTRHNDLNGGKVTCIPIFVPAYQRPVIHCGLSTNIEIWHYTSLTLLLSPLVFDKCFGGQKQTFMAYGLFVDTEPAAQGFIRFLWSP